LRSAALFRAWQRVRGSNPYFSLERALIYLHKILITRHL
jgi:hypothetical protein